MAGQESERGVSVADYIGGGLSLVGGVAAAAASGGTVGVPQAIGGATTITGAALRDTGVLPAGYGRTQTPGVIPGGGDLARMRTAVDVLRAVAQDMRRSLATMERLIAEADAASGQNGAQTITQQAALAAGKA